MKNALSKDQPDALNGHTKNVSDYHPQVLHSTFRRLVELKAIFVIIDERPIPLRGTAIGGNDMPLSESCKPARPYRCVGRRRNPWAISSEDEIARKVEAAQ